MLEKGSDIAAGAYEGDYPLQLFSASVPAGDMAAKTSLHLLRNRTQVLLQLGSFIQCAVPALTIGGEVQTNDHLLIEFPLACGRQGVTFSLPVSLSVGASSASITWERIASRPETGRLIPSIHNSYRDSRLPATAFRLNSISRITVVRAERTPTEPRKTQRHRRRFHLDWWCRKACSQTTLHY